MSKLNPVSTAVVGCGMISDKYITNLASTFSIIKLIACCDLVEDKAKEKAEKFNIKAMTFEEILEDQTIEMVVILTNPSTHYHLSKKALMAGKHVFSEKMIAVTLEEGQELLDIANEKKLYLGVAPDTFLGASIQTARFAIDSGWIGEPTSAIATVSRNLGDFGELLPHLNKVGGGMPFDMGGYYLSALVNILGPVKTIAGFAQIHNPQRKAMIPSLPRFGSDIQVEGPNVLVGSLEFENGVLGSIQFNSECIFPETRHLEIHGTEGVITVHDPNAFGGPVMLLRSGTEPAYSLPLTHGYKEESRGLGAAEMAWAIRNNRPNRASKEMAYHVFEIIHGIILSSENKCFYDMKSTCEKPAALLSGSSVSIFKFTQEKSIVE